MCWFYNNQKTNDDIRCCRCCFCCLLFRYLFVSIDALISAICEAPGKTVSNAIPCVILSNVTGGYFCTLGQVCCEPCGLFVIMTVLILLSHHPSNSCYKNSYDVCILSLNHYAAFWRSQKLSTETIMIIHAKKQLLCLYCLSY